MDFLLEENKLLLAKLLEKGVEFILVGGYAVNYHGYNRGTSDMDILVRPSNENKIKVLEALMEQGFDEEDLADIKSADFSGYFVFSMWEEPYKVDFLTRISGVNFDEAWEQKVFLPLNNYQVPVLHLHHLVLSKISNGRLQDKADVDQLQKIQAFKKGKP